MIPTWQAEIDAGRRFTWRLVGVGVSGFEPHRQLAFLYYQQKDSVKAKAAFERYLALKPDASDAKRIKEYLVELDR